MAATLARAMITTLAVLLPAVAHGQEPPPRRSPPPADSTQVAPTPTVFAQPRRDGRVLLVPHAPSAESTAVSSGTLIALTVRAPVRSIVAARRITPVRIPLGQRAVSRSLVPGASASWATSGSLQQSAAGEAALRGAATMDTTRAENVSSSVVANDRSPEPLSSAVARKPSNVGSPATRAAVTSEASALARATATTAATTAKTTANTTAPTTAPRTAPTTAASSALIDASASTPTSGTSPARATAADPARLTPANPPATTTVSLPTPSQERPGWAHVTYLSGPAVYLDVGTTGGLREGTRLEVVRGSTVIAELAVAYVSSSRSSCTVVTSTAPIVIGDSARFTPVREVLAQVQRAAAMKDSTTRPPARRASAPIRGRLGVRYLTMQQGGGGASTTLTQPAFDLRLDGHNLNGSPFGLTVDVRAYRQNYARTSGSTLTSSTRAYQTALLWNPVNSGTRVSLGRQFSSALSTVGLFDGVAVDVDRNRWSAGALSGSQPDPRSFGYSGDVREHGGYFQLHNTPNAWASWAMTIGGIGSYARGKIDREFAYLQGTFNSRYVSVYTAQEVDVNRGWKSTIEGGGATPTSTFAMLRVAPNDALSLSAGYDNRRSVRLYRDFLNPETTFDDSFRQGAWGGASLYVLGHLRLNADVRTSKGGVAGTADSYTGSVHLNRLTPLQLGAQLRTTRYTGALSSGALSAASLEIQPLGTLRLALNAGERSDTRAQADLANSSTTWWGADADVGIGRSLYLLASTYRESGAFQRNLQTMLAVSYRF